MRQPKDNFFAICFAMFAAGLLIVLFLPPQQPPIKAHQDPVKTEQDICGNAKWKLSADGKTLTCIPRYGRPYNVKISFNIR